jgi:hypothetical protein
MESFIAILTIFVLAYVQNVSFSVVSRSRNRNNMKYHLIAAFFSNSIWFLTFRQLVKADMTLTLFLPYCAGTMLGSLSGVWVSMRVERLLGAGADTHLKKTSSVTEERVLEIVEQKLAARQKPQGGVGRGERFGMDGNGRVVQGDATLHPSNGGV